MTTSVLENEPLVLHETTPSGRVKILTLNRPKALNAMSMAMSKIFFELLQAADADSDIRAIIVTGKGRSFCAGADVKELSKLTPESAANINFLADWNSIMHSLRTPVIAAVNGLALGGGFELALMCDIIFCASDAQFALPEINLGTIPGAGGTQRLITAVGKSLAYQMILTARRLNSQDALRHGLVAEVHSSTSLLENTIAEAETIAKRSLVTIALARSAINHAHRTVLEGLDYERRLYYESFGTKAFQEGCAAFFEKRPANFDNC